MFYFVQTTTYYYYLLLIISNKSFLQLFRFTPRFDLVTDSPRSGKQKVHYWLINHQKTNNGSSNVSINKCSIFEEFIYFFNIKIRAQKLTV